MGTLRKIRKMRREPHFFSAHFHIAVPLQPIYVVGACPDIVAMQLRRSLCLRGFKGRFSSRHYTVRGSYYQLNLTKICSESKLKQAVPFGTEV